MDRKALNLGIIADPANRSIAETHLKLVKQTAYQSCPCSTQGYDSYHPEKTTRMLEVQRIALVHVGTPGLKSYPRQLHGFLDAYAAVQHKPAAGIVTHDSDHTRYVVQQWLSGPSRSPHDLPDGALSIIDASRPLLPRSVEKALEILTGNIPTLSKPRLHAIPFTNVDVDVVVAGKKETKPSLE